MSLTLSGTAGPTQKPKSKTQPSDTAVTSVKAS